MKYHFLILFIITSAIFSSKHFAQADDSTKHHKWKFNIEASFYFENPFFILPVFTVDKGNWHLEKRYNYESLKTGSIWFGYNIKGGSDFNFIIVPMVGGLFGRIYGVAGGLELTLIYSDFQFYSEMEYVFDFETSSKNFFYNWTNLTYSPLDWLFAGLSTQRTKLYQTNSGFQWGPFAGVGFKGFGLTSYFYNPGSNDYYFIITLDYSF